MNIKYRLILMNFLQFFIWGSWLISLGAYLGATLHFKGVEIGNVFLTLGFAALFSPAVMGIIADKWINAEKVFGLCHIIGGCVLIWLSTIRDYDMFFWVMLLNSIFYMPTIALNNTVSYIILEQRKMEIVKEFPAIRVWGTIGFIAAMWVVNLVGWMQSANQFYISAASAIFLGIYSFTLPKCPPSASKEKKSLIQTLGLDAFVLFAKRRMAIFFIFSMLLGAALQVTNMFGALFLESFNTTYPDSFAVKYPNLLISLSQISETLFILTIPFFLRRFGIKNVMLMSIFAWFFRFALFGIGNPGDGLILLILSMVVYGMAFDFFNISGSLFVEKEVPTRIRASAQGLFMLMTNGLGTMIGAFCSGWIVDRFSVYDAVTKEAVSRDWPNIWFSFAAYALVLGVIFPFVFRYKHDRTMQMDLKH